MQQRHNLYLIFKEAINNALKYAAAKNMVILLEKEANIMKMEIRDDGKGFDAGSNYSGNGIKNMHFRAQAISGKLYISSSPGNGSQVSLHFPIT